ncbi:MAG: radical SAM protein [Thermoplasmata archaeon]
MVTLKLSLGSAISLNLIKGKLQIPFTTIYIMLGDRCISNCSFCTQSREAMMTKKLSRITWYEFPMDAIINAIKGKNYSRICFQTLDYENVIYDLKNILPKFNKLNIPISVSIAPPLNGKLEEISPFIDTVSIALDGASKEIFEKVKGWQRGNRFEWENHWKNLILAKKYFKNVNTHLIIGMGEKDFDLISVMLKLKNKGIETALFAYTPVTGIGIPPSLERYRKIQLSRCLIYEYEVDINDFIFNENGDLEKIKSKYLDRVLKDSRCFMTSGCPGCNRPFYNEEPRKIYNYPFLPDKGEMLKINETLAKIK